MNFKLLVLLASLAVFAETVRVPLLVKKLMKENNKYDTMKKFSPNVSYKDTAVMVNVEVFGIGKDSTSGENPYGSYLFTLDTSSNYSWVAGKDCSAPFGKKYDKTKGEIVSKTSIDPKVEKELVTHGDVDGYMCVSCSLELFFDKNTGYRKTFSKDLLIASYVGADLVNRIPSESAGVISLLDKTLVQDDMNRIMALFINPLNVSHSSLFFADAKDNDIFIPDGLSINIPRRYMNSNSKEGWVLNLDYISNSEGQWKNWAIGGGDAIIDTTYSGISGPAKDVNSINQYIGTDEDGRIDCERVRYLQPLQIHIGGLSYKLSPRNYIKKGENKLDRMCLSVFEVQNSYNDRWRLGLAFMQQFLTYFTLTSGEPPSIAFVPLNMTYVKLNQYNKLK